MSERLQRIRQQSHHSQIQADGSRQCDANPHRAPLRGEDHGPASREKVGENYRPNKDGKRIPGEGSIDSQPHFGSKETAARGKFDPKEPKPKGEHDSSGRPFKSTRAPLPTPSSYKKK